MVGIPAAIANAISHATGKRLGDLPITPDKLLEIDWYNLHLELHPYVVALKFKGETDL